MQPIRVLTIAGSDSGGGAGIQADIKTITVLGGFGMSVITALTAQNTLGVQGIYEIAPEFIARQFDAVAQDIGIDAAKTGMLANTKIIRTIAEKIRQYHIEKLVVDPVMAAKGGAALIADDAQGALIRELLPLAFVITPNIPEAEVLSSIVINSIEDMKKAAQIIHRQGVKHVVIKGGHLVGSRKLGAVDILYDGDQFHEFTAEWIPTRDTHGTGCTFSAALATMLASGKDVTDAVQGAKVYITQAIRHAWRIGGGQGPTNHLAPLSCKLERYECLQGLRDALRVLTEEKCGGLIPEVQSNLGYALPVAVSGQDVAAFPGRIIRIGEGCRAICGPAFGASSHIARIILTAMKHDPAYRSAMNIRFSEEVLKACEALGYTCDSFDRSAEPVDIKTREGSTLEWGTEAVLVKRETIPDIIYDRGEVGKEPMIRVLGKSPLEVINKVLAIGQQIKGLR
ncbi:MAG: bifunctional hydroxymethylpyrimidine kinase/phosphomethylpyrimidine kinase [Deltaproteobacteria bacterium]|nr:bifunctional hydroxymethylpyrimidine kinase/phosphomethylpyrimidine kinase [Deltaproteobacteria bacterium]